VERFEFEWNMEIVNSSTTRIFRNGGRKDGGRMDSVQALSWNLTGN